MFAFTQYVSFISVFDMFVFPLVALSKKVRGERLSRLPYSGSGRDLA